MTSTDGSKERSSTQSVFSNTQSVFLNSPSVSLGGFQNDTYLLSQNESRLPASRAQFPVWHPAYFLAVSQHWKYTPESNNLLTVEVEWTGCSLCVELQNHTRNYEPRHSRRWALRKSEDRVLARKFTCWHQELFVVKKESAPTEFSHVELRVKQSRFQGLRAVLLPAELKWQIHTHHTAQQCLSLENTNLGQTEPFYERSSWTDVLCVGHGKKINALRRWVLWDEFLLWRSKHIVSFSSVTSLH